jgi:peptidoglycan L-alanyl-D-glutamate endopeptidase CwlK
VTVPLDLVRRIDIDQLYLPFVEQVLEVVAACRARGADYFAVSGYRSDEEQARLYNQGRTTPGPVVTQARPGQSAHNFGLAVDFVRDGYLDRAGLQPDWRPESYDVLGEEALRRGLAWGGSWAKPDRPHVQWPVSSEGLVELRAPKEAGGLSAVFSLLDARRRT